MLFRYSRWDGSQDIQTLTADDLMKQIAEEVLGEGDLETALQRMLQRGMQLPTGRRVQGLRDLLDRLRNRRGENLQRYNLGSMFDDLKEKLDQIIDTERQGIEKRLGDQDDSGPQNAEGAPQGQQGGQSQQRQQGQPSGASGQSRAGGQGQQGEGQGGSQQGEGGDVQGGMDPGLREMLERIANRRLEQLEQLPPDVGGRIRELRDYDFMDPEARQQFEELLQMLQQQMMQNYFSGLQQGLQSMTPESMQQLREMVQDLNQLLEQRMRGEEPDFSEFMQKWGQFFPEGIENVDQLAEYMQQQMAAMESLLNSMTPEMRSQLQDMINSLFNDPGFQSELAQLTRNLERLNPGSTQGNDFNFLGDDPISLQEAMRLMGDMNKMDELEREFMQAIRTNDASDIDSDEVDRLLGEEARHMIEQLKELTRMLEEAGLIRRRGDEWELTPRAIRKIGEKALEDVFGSIKSSDIGDHGLDRRGFGVERLDETKRYSYGDPFDIDAERSIMNAVLREGHGTPVSMKKDDFEIYRTEMLTQCSTVIMLDMSYSMMMGGRFQAGRKVALALNSLIRSKFPKDNLYVVAFSYFVLTLRPEMLLDSYWIEYGGGTNFQEALRQARKTLAKHNTGTKQIIFITDGEPTTYSGWYGDGWGHRRSGGVVEETLREVIRCTRDNITINTFMMARERALSDFVQLITKVNRGRAFFTTPSRMGEYILLDYVNNKRKVVR